MDHSEHSTSMFITEHGIADLRGLSPRQRAEKMIAVAHPDYRPLLREYVERANELGGHTPHDLATAFEFHTRLAQTGTMKK